VTPPAPRVFTTDHAKRKRAESTKRYWASPAGRARAEKFGTLMLEKREAAGMVKNHGKKKAETRVGLDEYGSPGTDTGTSPSKREPSGPSSGAHVATGLEGQPSTDESRKPAATPGEPVVPSTVTIGSAMPPPENKSQYMAPPSSVAGLIKPAGPTEKEPLWNPRPATPEEGNALVEAFVRLELKGFDALATWADWDGWHHDPSEMEPDRVIWRYVLKRLKFDPGLLLVAIAAIEIMEREGERVGRYRKETKGRRPARESAGGGGDVDPQAIQSNDLREVAPA
jgi:hypothetical protein